jgi:hypothetical protein
MIEYLYIAAFAFWFAELSSVPQLVLHWINFLYWVAFGNHNILDRLKPFDCVKCLAFWAGGIYTYHLTDSILYSVFCGGLVSLVAMVLDKIYYKLK